LVYLFNRTSPVADGFAATAIALPINAFAPEPSAVVATLPSQ
jgi:hypothetical protein